MKLEFLLSRASALGLLAALAGLTFNAIALPLFAAAVSLWVLLIATGDYARRPSYSSTLAPVARRHAVLPLAA